MILTLSSPHGTPDKNLQQQSELSAKLVTDYQDVSQAFLQGNEEMSCRAYQLLGVLLALLTDSGKIGKDQYHPLMQELR